MARTRERLVRLFTVLAPFTIVALLSGPAEAGPGGFVYVLQQANQIHGFRFDQATGTLRALAGFPVPSGTGANSSAQDLAYHDGRLYAVNDGTNTLSVFSVDLSTGALSAMPFSPIALGAGNWNCVDVHPSGSPVVVTQGSFVGGINISSFVMTAVGATPAAGSPYATGGASPQSCGFSRDGSYVYVAGGGGPTANIAGFSVDAGTGVLTALSGSPYETARYPLTLATDSSARVFVATADNTNDVRAFTASSGVLTPAAGNPFVSGLTSARHGIVHPAGFYMVADGTGNRVGVYNIEGSGTATTLTAVSGSPFASNGTSTGVLAVTSNGGHLLATNSSSRNLTVYAVNQSSGALTFLSIQAPNTIGTTGAIIGLAFAPDEAGFVYTLNEQNGGANEISGFRISHTSGALTAVAGFPMTTGGNGASAAAAEYMAYRHGRVYVLNDGSDSLSAFKVNRTTGALTPLPFSPIALASGANLGCVAVHPSGSPVVVGYAGGGVESIVVGPSTATFAAGSPFATSGPISFSCAFSQDGSDFYTGGNSGTAVDGYKVNASTGVLTPMTGSPFETSGSNAIAAYATDSSGRLFTAMRSSMSHLWAFTTVPGGPSSVSGNPFAATGLDQPVQGVVHPGGFYLTAARNSSNIGSFRIAGSGVGTTLTAAAGSPVTSGGVATTALALTASGKYLLAANALSRNLTVFQVNQGTGALATVSLQAANALGTTGRISGLTIAPPVPPFVDDPLIALSVIQPIHIMDLRSRVDGVRAQHGLAPYAYLDPTLTVGATLVRAAHVADLRAALGEIYAALGLAGPSYTDPAITVGVTVAKAVHITELRTAVLAVE
jgi:6-phosphogluconolactonase (cycloisomerase 2 family)